jgi:hypothetical protein
MGFCKPIINGDLFKRRRKSNLPALPGLRSAGKKCLASVSRGTESYAMNHTSADGPHQQKAMPDFKSLVFAAKREGSQKIQPASTNAIIKESALNGRLSITA